MNPAAISDREFEQIRGFIHAEAGISLAPSKKALVCGRLGKRLQSHGLASYAEYFRLITGPGGAEEAQLAIDLLTTNETYFFREPSHFQLLGELAAAARGRGVFRVWSAAASSGEEAYSIAMVLADRLGTGPWEVVATDISNQVLERARAARFPLARAQHVPDAYLRRFCLKGTGTSEGTILVQRSVRERVCFGQVNLNRPLPELGTFDVIFLRNVMIYFDADTKREVVRRVAALLRPDGRLLIGHSESLHDLACGLAMRVPSVYARSGEA